jgi:hypothetical protein
MMTNIRFCPSNPLSMSFVQVGGTQAASVEDTVAMRQTAAATKRRKTFMTLPPLWAATKILTAPPKKTRVCTMQARKTFPQGMCVVWTTTEENTQSHNTEK